MEFLELLRSALFVSSTTQRATCRSFFKWCQQTFLDAVADETICFSDLTIGLRVRRRCKLQLDAYTFAIVLEFSGSEVAAIARDYAVGDTEPKNYPLYEVYC
jgi:hypothetical protein